MTILFLCRSKCLLFIYLCINSSICLLFINFSICTFYLFLHFFIHLFVYLIIYLFIYLSIYLFICPFIYPFICLPIHIPVFSSIYRPIYNSSATHLDLHSFSPFYLPLLLSYRPGRTSKNYSFSTRKN